MCVFWSRCSYIVQQQLGVFGRRGVFSVGFQFTCYGCDAAHDMMCACAVGESAHAQLVRMMAQMRILRGGAHIIWCIDCISHHMVIIYSIDIMKACIGIHTWRAWIACIDAYNSRVYIYQYVCYICIYMYPLPFRLWRFSVSQVLRHL